MVNESVAGDSSGTTIGSRLREAIMRSVKSLLMGVQDDSTARPLSWQPRTPRFPSVANWAGSRRYGNRTPQECGRDILGRNSHRLFRLSLTPRLFQEIQGNDDKKPRPPGNANLTEIPKPSLWREGLFYDFWHRFAFLILSYGNL